MNGLLYVTLTSAKNRFLRAIKKPVTYLYTLLVIGYFILIIPSFGVLAEDLRINTDEGFALVLSVLVFFLLPANLVAYARKKGVLFQNSDVQFIFQSPISPKLVLVYTQIKQILISLIIYSVIAIIGLIYCNVSPIKMLLYFISAFIVENILETCIMIFLYGNEKLSAKQLKYLGWTLFLVIGAAVAFGLYLFFTQEPSVKIINTFLSHPIVQCIPILGWNIAVIRLFFLGANTVNVVCSILYLLSAILFVIYICKMECTGLYYEDAMSFAEDYAIKKERSRNGEIKSPFKEKLKKATVEYKGEFAKAIYYRQVLEYKKHPFFIFGFRTLLCLGISIALAVFGYINSDADFEGMQIFILPGMMAYITFIFSTTTPKWIGDLKNPYTFLIPDTPFKKLWYSTKMEHIKAVADGICFTVPAMLTLKLGAFFGIATIVLYWALQAVKIYIDIISDAMLVKFLGKVGCQLLKMLTEGVILTIGIVAAVGGAILINMEAGFIAMILVLLGITVALAVISSLAFEKMEMLE